MTFRELAEYFERLEETSSRLTLIDILSQLFSKVELSEIGHVAYLIQGRVGPFFEPIEIGMSEKLVASSIARAYGVDKEDVLKEYGKLGDLGIVAQQLNSKFKIQNSKLLVNEVFEIFRGIAKLTGEGTVEKKISTLAQLLKASSPVEAKHLSRIPLGTSRLGIGDPTILDAFAKLKLGDRSKRKVLEGAYNKVSDLGLIGQTLWKGGESAVLKMNIVVGRPLRSQLAERINDPKTILEKFGGIAHVQQKWDGFRVQIHKDGSEIRLFSRNLEETTAMMPDILEGVRKQVKEKSIILDSEAIAYNPVSEEFLPFQETTKRRRKYGIEQAAKNLPLKAFVFDIMYLNGKSLVDLPLRQRMEYLKKSIEGDEVLIKQPGEFTDDPKKIDELFQDALTKGLEGLIVKRPDSLYEAGARNFNWIKLKKHSAGPPAGGLKDTIDCVILGYIFGRGKRASFGAGALLVGVYDNKKDEFVTVAKIGTGLTDEEWKSIQIQSSEFRVQNKPARVNSLITPSVWVEPKIVVEILADEITKSPVHTAGKEGSEPGYALRFPRLVRFRGADKKPEDATTVKELVEMYQQQYKK